MTYHNGTCGCADCGNYGQVYNPQAIHNQSCGCAACGNYEQATRATPPTPKVVMVEVPTELAEEVYALIRRRRGV